MSRSYRKTPIIGTGGQTRMKWWKRKEHKRYRAYVRDKLNKGHYETIQRFKGQFGNEWDSPRDGKMWFGELKGAACTHSGDPGKYWIAGAGCAEGRHIWCNFEYRRLMRK